ncbi:MAG: hypothetical protein LBS23_02345 [Holosporaceae bacterium]|jgi:hypothetical protein|nr:hypothetical protein [Holosporaceae bacterium]
MDNIINKTEIANIIHVICDLVIAASTTKNEAALKYLLGDGNSINGISDAMSIVKDLIITLKNSD